MQTNEITDFIVNALENIKAQDIQIINVQERTAITDRMIIATGTSNRHVQAITESVHEALKTAGIKTNGIEGRSASDWILLDVFNVVVHVMTAQARQFYDLERLWGEPKNVQEQTQS